MKTVEKNLIIKINNEAIVNMPITLNSTYRRLDDLLVDLISKNLLPHLGLLIGYYNYLSIEIKEIEN